MKLSELLADIPSDDVLRELFPYDKLFSRCSLKTRPCVTHRELGMLSLWLQGYSKSAIGRSYGMSGSAVWSLLIHVQFRLPRLAVVMDTGRIVSSIRKNDPVIDIDAPTVHADALWRSRQPVASEQDLLTMASYQKHSIDMDGCARVKRTGLCLYKGPSERPVCLECARQYFPRREPSPIYAIPELEDTYGTSD